jgi:hypothetical protein
MDAPTLPRRKPPIGIQTFATLREVEVDFGHAARHAVGFTSRTRGRDAAA